ncbi:MAG: helix-turn-helix transcriptional regulator [Blastochloris sp.]|nr:helix-turn-helix transcriptional regulator [Blastochloris sp.]
MEGLADLVHADCWVWALSREHASGDNDAMSAFLTGGFSTDRLARYLEAVEHPEMASLTGPTLETLRRQPVPLTRLLQQMATVEEFMAHPAYPLWKEANIGALMISIRPLELGCFSTIGLYRKQGDALFTPQEARIAHILLSEVPWLHETGWPEDRGALVPLLSPRLRVVLNLLLEGLARKQIGQHLRISPHTVDGYIKDIYRHFGVQSQAELMRRFYCGDGGDHVSSPPDSGDDRIAGFS